MVYRDMRIDAPDARGMCLWQAAVSIARRDRVVALESWASVWNVGIIDVRNVKGLNGVNLAMGYRLIEIRSPVDVVRSVEAEK